MENFVLYDEIGSGNKRIVYKGRRKGSVEYFAIHCIDKSKRLQIQNNVRICHELEHPHVVLFKEWYETTNHLWLVVELCTGDTLQTILKQDSFLPESTVKSFGKDIVRGLAYLHSQEVIYADLQPAKLLLDSDGTLKYSNFSFARLLGEPNIIFPTANSVSSSSENNLPGSLMHMAPELLCGGNASKSTDLWSLGCVLYEMFTGTPPFRAISYEKLCEQIVEAKTPYPMQGQNGTYTKASENLYMLIQGLLQKDPSQRIDWLELCLHPFWDGELSSLADMLDDVKIFSTASSRCESNLTNYETTLDDHREIQTDVEAIELDESLEGNVEEVEEKDLAKDQKPLFNAAKEVQSIVPKASAQRRIQTTSLQIVPDEKTSLSASVQSERASSKLAWQGTYKLERGLAVMDLTEVGDNKHDEAPAEEAVSPSYVKTREVKASQVYNSKGNIDMEASVSSASMLGLSEVIPVLGDLSLNILDHLYHPSDLIVMPIAENSKLRKLPSLKWEAGVLGFPAFSLEKLQSKHKDELREHVKLVFVTYVQLRKGSHIDKTTVKQKMSILAYMNTLVKVEEASNFILEEELVKDILQDLKTAGFLELKARIARVLGAIASCATYISPSFSMAEIFAVATEQIKQNFRMSQIKQSFLPVVGEFLFYAATQEESENREIRSWEPSGAVFTIINKCLQQSEDYITRHIAAKIIENVTSVTGRYCKKFLTNDFGVGLWNLYNHASSDMEKQTASSALCRISMHNVSVLQHVCDRASLGTFQIGLFTGPQKSQQAFVTIFVSLVSSPTHGKRIMQDQQLIKKVIGLLESSNFVVRGKMYLLLSEMCIHAHDVLLLCCETRLVTHIERDSKRIFMAGKENRETLEYLHQCMTVLVNGIVSVVPRIIDGVLHILQVVSGRHHPNPAQVKQLKIHLPLLQIILHLATSSMFRKRLIDAVFIQYIGKLMEHICHIDKGEINLTSNATRSLAENATNTMFSIVEAIAQHPPLMLAEQEHIMRHILPALASFGKSENGNLRILSWKLFSDVLTLYLDNEDAKTARSQAVEKMEDRLFKVLEEYFLPEFDNLLQDQDLLRSYCLKLLHSCSERYPKVLQNLIDRNLISTLLAMLRNYQGDINSSVLHSTVGILNNIVSNKDIDFMGLCKRDLIDYLSSAFIEVASAMDDSVNTDSTSPLLLQLLDTLHHVLKSIELVVKSVLTSKTPTVTTSVSRLEVEELLGKSKVLSELSGILVNLLVYDDEDIQKWACRCLYLSVELFGGEQEECYGDENIDCICQYIKTNTRKQQKIMLRILKRLVTSNDNLRRILNHDQLRAVLTDLKDFNVNDSDDKTVKSLSAELLKFVN